MSATKELLMGPLQICEFCEIPLKDCEHGQPDDTYNREEEAYKNWKESQYE